MMAPAWADSLGFDEAGQDVPVVISATRLQQSLLDTPAAVTVIDRNLIHASGARELQDILRLVPGMVVGRESGSEAFVGYHGTSADGARRMQVQVDGRSIYEAGLARVDWIGLPLDVEDIERIEVVRGPNSATHGANSFFAVVNIISRHPQDLPAAELLLRSGDNGIGDGFARLAGRALGADWAWSFFHREDNGFDRNARNGKPFLDDKRVDGVYGKGVWVTPRDGQFTFASGVSRMVAEQVRLNDTSIYRELPVAANDTGYLSLEWQQPWADRHRLQVQAHVNTLRHQEPWRVSLPYMLLSPELSTLWQQDKALADRFAGNPLRACQAMGTGNAALDAACARASDPAAQVFRDYTTDQDYRETRSELEISDIWVPNDSLRVIGGLQAAYAEVDSRTFLNGKASNTVLSLFGHGEFRLTPQWLLNLGGTIEDDAHAGHFFSPRAGLSWQFSPDQVLRLVHSRAVRTPDIFEDQLDWHYYTRADVPTGTYDDGAFYQSAKSEGNTRSERIRSNEISYYGSFRRVSVDVRLFQDELKLTRNQLEINDLVISGYEPYRMRGAEIGSEWRMTAFQRLLLNYARLAINRDGHGDNVDFVPRHSGSLTWARLDPDGWRASATYGFYNNLNKDIFFDRADLHLGRVFPIGQRQRLDIGLTAQIRLTDDPELRRANGMSSRQKVWASIGWHY